MSRRHRDPEFFVVAADPTGTEPLRVGGSARLGSIPAPYIRLNSSGGPVNFAGADSSAPGYGYVGTFSNHEFRVYANSGLRVSVSAAGVVTVANLAGTGSRTVVADANGVLSAP